MITPIWDHTDEALGRLIQQFVGKFNLEALLTALVDPTQDIEDALNDLYGLRSLADASGYQLDRLGTVVGQARNGLSDSDYLVQLRARIGKNISQGQPELAITVAQTILNPGTLQLLEYFPAQAAVAIDVSPGTQAQIDAFLDAFQNVLGAGIRAVEIVSYNPAHKFAFAGGNFPAWGFGDLNNPAAGGGFATLSRHTKKQFAFQGLSPNPLYAGFGTINDPLVGGVMPSL